MTIDKQAVREAMKKCPLNMGSWNTDDYVEWVDTYWDTIKQCLEAQLND